MVPLQRLARVAAAARNAFDGPDERAAGNTDRRRPVDGCRDRPHRRSPAAPRVECPLHVYSSDDVARGADRALPGAHDARELLRRDVDDARPRRAVRTRRLVSRGRSRSQPGAIRRSTWAATGAADLHRFDDPRPRHGRRPHLRAGTRGDRRRDRRALRASDCVAGRRNVLDERRARFARPRQTRRARDGTRSVSGSERQHWQCSRRFGARTILVHINNTNPILLDDSPERATVGRSGVEVAYDGMEVDAVTSTVRSPSTSAVDSPTSSSRSCGRRARATTTCTRSTVRMNDGELTREELQRWVANRYYYQVSIPLKDAAILSNCPERDVRREWIQRILDHDGDRRGRRRDRVVAASRRGARRRPRGDAERAARACRLSATRSTRT